MSNSQVTKQIIVVTQAAMNPKMAGEKSAFFDEDGTPYTFPQSATGESVLMTDYTGESADDVAATDTVNEAVGKIEARVAASETAIAALPEDGSEMVLTGYVAAEVDDVAATDTVNEAIAKLEARIAALEA